MRAVVKRVAVIEKKIGDNAELCAYQCCGRRAHNAETKRQYFKDKRLCHNAHSSNSRNPQQARLRKSMYSSGDIHALYYTPPKR